MLKRYFKALYQRTMEKAYDLAYREIISAFDKGGIYLDCGANIGWVYEKRYKEIPLTKEQYFGIEWNEKCVTIDREKGLNIQQGDLNRTLPYEDDKFTCVYALSVLEHLLNGCQFMKEYHRVLRADVKLVLLTPNISTYFTVILILAGKMPSSGPHPDSDLLMKTEEVFKVSSDSLTPNIKPPALPVRCK